MYGPPEDYIEAYLLSLKRNGMAQITLAKALKLKNRLAGRLAKVQSDIQTYNSVLKEQVGKVDIPACVKLYDQLQETLIGLKTKIVLANSPIQETLIRMGELKSKMTLLDGIHVRDGAERHSYQNTEILWVATLTKEKIDAERKSLETQIDILQDAVDSFNHAIKMEIPQSYLDLAS